MPVDGLRVASSGYKPLTIDEKTLDGSLVQIGVGKWTLEPIPKARVHVPELESGVTCLVDGQAREGGSDFELATGEHRYVYKLTNHVDKVGRFVVQGGIATNLPKPGEWTVDSSVMDYIKQKLEEVKQCLDVEDGELGLRTYHEIWKMGYRLTEDDKGNIEAAFEICKQDYKKKLDRAIKDPRFDEAEVRRWWQSVLALYYDLTGKR